MQSHVVYLGLGSNQADPVKQLKRAVDAIKHWPTTSLIAHASLYISRPVDNSLQPDFYNSAVKISSKLSPSELLSYIKKQESSQQRIHHYHWGPRTIDIDILLFDTLCLQRTALTIPHQEISQRDFVLRPLLEIDETLTLPDGTPLRALLANCPKNISDVLSTPHFKETVLVETC